jgi:hypothetical protein
VYGGGIYLDGSSAITISGCDIAHNSIEVCTGVSILTRAHICFLQTIFQLHCFTAFNIFSIFIFELSFSQNI